MLCKQYAVYDKKSKQLLPSFFALMDNSGNTQYLRCNDRELVSPDQTTAFFIKKGQYKLMWCGDL